MSVRILTGDCRAVLAGLPDASVQCCVTSPPYYGLRRYLAESDPNAHKEIGLEQTPAEYVEQMVSVFREVKRILREDGVCFLNLGDSYAANRAYQVTDNKHVDVGNNGASRVPDGLKPKDLLGIPWRVAFALQADGWRLRSDIIWHKPNPMPESVTDRPTSAHEHVFLLAKRDRYFFDADAIAEPSSPNTHARLSQDVQNQVVSFRANGGAKTNGPMKAVGRKLAVDGSGIKNNGSFDAAMAIMPATRNSRSVWTIATESFREAHFATFPTELAERCIKAGTSERGCCANCGAPWVRLTERGRMPRDMARPQAQRAVELYEINDLTPAHIDAIRACGVTDAGKAVVTQTGAGKNGEAVQALAAEAKAALGGYHREFLLTAEVTCGWSPSCACNAAVDPCAVLDPFGGAGTTALVADRLGRNAILIELNPDYAAMAERRIHGDAPLFADVAAQ